MKINTNRLLTTLEAAALLGLRPQTLRRWRSEDLRAGLGNGRPGRGGLTWIRIGGAVRYVCRGPLAFAAQAASPLEAQDDRG